MGHIRWPLGMTHMFRSRPTIRFSTGKVRSQMQGPPISA